MEVSEQRKVDALFGQYGIRLHLEEWERLLNVVASDDMIMVAIDTYEVKVLVREDRYTRKGTRVQVYTKTKGRWKVESEHVSWEDDFQPFTFEKIGRRKTADETIAQREWEKLCYRPGNRNTPLDSYERVLDPFIRSTDKMERYY